MEHKVISFYQYAIIKDPKQLKDSLRTECQKLNLLGRILIAKEGINGAVSGRINKIELFKAKLLTYFPELTFREQVYPKPAYHKLVVRVRPEICAFNAKVDINKVGTHLNPEQLQELYLKNEEFYIIDARNNYEFQVGRFKGAINLPIKRFREFPQAVKQLEPLKDKKIILYCTGGVRCEKASAYLKEQGFTDVNQLQGGVINYVNTIKENQEWKGGLFVFDDRLVSDTGKAITNCQFCGQQSKEYTNCHNLDCDKLFIACDNCLRQKNYSCSEQCLKSERRRKETAPPKEIIGKVKNYYSKVGIALIETKEQISPGMNLSFSGKTTNFSQEVTEFVQHKAGEITLPVKEKVRRNDQVVLA